MSSRAIEASQSNLAVWDQAGAEFLCGDILEVLPQIPEGALVLTNPPYGKRLEDTQAVKMLLRAVKMRPDLSPVLALVGGPGRELLPKSAPALLRTKNGGLSVSVRRLDSAS